MKLWLPLTALTAAGAVVACIIGVVLHDSMPKPKPVPISREPIKPAAPIPPNDFERQWREGK